MHLGKVKCLFHYFFVIYDDVTALIIQHDFFTAFIWDYLHTKFQVSSISSIS